MQFDRLLFLVLLLRSWIRYLFGWGDQLDLILLYYCLITNLNILLRFLFHNRCFNKCYPVHQLGHGIQFFIQLNVFFVQFVFATRVGRQHFHADLHLNQVPELARLDLKFPQFLQLNDLILLHLVAGNSQFLQFVVEHFFKLSIFDIRQHLGLVGDLLLERFFPFESFTKALELLFLVLFLVILQGFDTPCDVMDIQLHLCKLL